MDAADLHQPRPRTRRAAGRRRTLTAIVSSLACGAVLLVTSEAVRRPAKPVSGAAINSDTGAVDDRPRRSLRVAIFNTQNGRGADGVTDHARTAAAVESFDLVGLCEVRGDLIGGLLGGDANRVRTLGRLTHMPWLFAPSEYRFWHNSFGNGLLCRVPVTFYHAYPLAQRKHSALRNMIHARILLGDQPVNVLITHLNRGNDRSGQFEIAAQTFLSMQAPAILMGDLNTSGDDPQMRTLLSTPGVISAVDDTPALRASERIDWILLRGLQPAHTGTIRSIVSDHPLVWAEVELPPAPSTARAASVRSRPRSSSSTP